MSAKPFIATLGLLGLLAAVAGPVRAQTVITGSPIPSPIPVNPSTGHSLRHSSPSTSATIYGRHYQYRKHYPHQHQRVQRFEPRSAEGYRQYYRGTVAPDFERRDRFGRRVIIIEAGGANIVVD